MLPEERKTRIVEYLAQHNFADVDTLAQVVQASPATVRRDLNEMAERGVITRTRGGASLVVHGVGHEPPYLARVNENPIEKRAIAQLASTFVREGEVIALDVGSTTLELAKAIRDRRNVTVFTASLAIAQVLLQSDVSVIVVGGILRKKELSMAGTIATQIVSQFHFDKFFLGTAGVSVNDGFTDFGIDDVDVKKAFLVRSQETIALADHTKLGHVSFAMTCPLLAVRRLITDADLAQVDALRQAGLEVLVARNYGPVRSSRASH
jgi:DeoR/GlpR family transcriptional regulator of sugar metabolism